MQHAIVIIFTTGGAAESAMLQEWSSALHEYNDCFMHVYQSLLIHSSDLKF